MFSRAVSPDNKIILDEQKKCKRRSLLERVFLKGVCPIFDVSMLGFTQKTVQNLLEDLTANFSFPCGKRDKASFEIVIIKLLIKPKSIILYR